MNFQREDSRPAQVTCPYFHSAFFILHSAFLIFHSAFYISHSVFCLLPQNNIPPDYPLQTFQESVSCAPTFRAHANTCRMFRSVDRLFCGVLPGGGRRKQSQPQGVLHEDYKASLAGADRFRTI